MALVAALLSGGCAAGGGAGVTEAQAREIAIGVGLREAHRADSDFYRTRLEVGEAVSRTAPSGSTYWDVTLVDPTGIRRLCVRVRNGGQSVGYRRCDPPGRPSPAAPPAPGDDDQSGDVARS